MDHFTSETSTPIAAVRIAHDPNRLAAAMSRKLRRQESPAARGKSKSRRSHPPAGGATSRDGVDPGE